MTPPHVTFNNEELTLTLSGIGAGWTFEQFGHLSLFDEATVRQELEGNICRCTGYHNIVKAVLDAAGKMKVAQAAE